MGQKFVYKFVSFPEVVKTENKIPFKVKKIESILSKGAFLFLKKMELGRRYVMQCEHQDILIVLGEGKGEVESH